jgi:hypothetical protein
MSIDIESACIKVVDTFRLVPPDEVGTCRLVYLADTEYFTLTPTMGCGGQDVQSAKGLRFRCCIFIY